MTATFFRVGHRVGHARSWRLPLGALLLGSLLAGSATSACRRAAAKANCGDMEPGLRALADTQVRDTAPEVRAHVENMITSSISRLKDMMIERCNADRWSPSVIGCFAKVGSNEQMADCILQLQPAQKQAFEKSRAALAKPTKDPNRPGDCEGAAAALARLYASTTGWNSGSGSAVQAIADQHVTRVLTTCRQAAWRASQTDCFKNASNVELAVACAAELATGLGIGHTP